MNFISRIKALFSRLARSKKLPVALPVLLIATFLFLVPKPAFAFWGSLIAGIAAIGLIYTAGSAVFAALLDILFYLITTVIGWLLNFSTWLLDIALSPGVGKISNFPLVQDMVPVTTGIANLVLVAILIIIALATIVGIESYGLRRLLPLLIVIALIVNFSTVIAGLVIDAGQTVMNFFAGNSFLGSTNIPTYVQKNFNLSYVLAATQTGNLEELFASSGITLPLSRIDSTLIKLVVYTFILLLGGLAFYIFLRLDILLFMRFAVFWILLIVAPLAFILGIIPAGRGYLRSWWEQLLNWSFLGPIVLFFTYLGLAAWGFLNNITILAEFLPLPGEEALVSGAAAGSLNPALSVLIVFPIVAFFFIYAINISKRMAGAAANAVVDSVIGLGKAITIGGAALVTGAALAGVGGALLRQPFVKRAYERLQQIPFKPLQATGRRLEVAHRGAVEEEQKRAKGVYAGIDALSSADIERRLPSMDARQKVQAAGILQERKERGLSREFAQEALRLAPSIDKEVERRLKRSVLHGRYYSEEPEHVKTGNIKLAEAYNYMASNNIRGIELAPEALETPALAGLLDYRQLVEIARRGSVQQLQGAVTGVEELAKQTNLQLEIAEALGKARGMARADIDKFRVEYRKAITELAQRVRDEEIFKAGRIGEFVKPQDVGGGGGGGTTT